MSPNPFDDPEGGLAVSHTDAIAAVADPEAGPLPGYRALRRDHRLRYDACQELAAEKLQLLHRRLAGYDPTRGPGWQEILRLKRREPPPEGLYLYGSVGRGKSMLMDLFFATAPVERKRRAHFHEFMRDVHARINRFRRTEAGRRDGDDPIPPVAKELADEAWLLCFDELEVRDIADAMILSRLFTTLFERGVVVVSTSNRAPDELYKGGLNRQLFLPFIDLLKRQMDVLHLDGGTDHRMAGLATMPVYHVPVGPASREALDEIFATLTDGAEPAPDTVEVMGRTIPVPRAARGVARFRFDDLCRKPLAANDYLAIAEKFHTVFLDAIPVMGENERHEARRFVLLVDVLYDARIKLLCSADAPPDRLYRRGDGTFEFERTVSRLTEMQTADYLAAPRR